MKALLVVILLLGAAAVATYARYGSFDPCAWIERDLAEDYDLPPIVLRARLRGGFLLRGITDPTPYDCLTEWWTLRSENLREGF